MPPIRSAERWALGKMIRADGSVTAFRDAFSGEQHFGRMTAHGTGCWWILGYRAAGVGYCVKYGKSAGAASCPFIRTVDGVAAKDENRRIEQNARQGRRLSCTALRGPAKKNAEEDLYVAFRVHVYWSYQTGCDRQGGRHGGDDVCGGGCRMPPSSSSLPLSREESGQASARMMTVGAV